MYNSFQMKVQIKLVDTSLPLPAYHTHGAVAFDLYARTTTMVTPMNPTIIPANIIVKVPEGYALILASRSSTPIKKGLMIANGIGIIDQDYHGDKDEIGVQVLNFTSKSVTVNKGERIAQAMLVKITKVEDFEVVSSIAEKSRGGFGTTG